MASNEEMARFFSMALKDKGFRMDAVTRKEINSFVDTVRMGRLPEKRAVLKAQYLYDNLRHDEE